MNRKKIILIIFISIMLLVVAACLVLRWYFFYSEHAMSLARESGYAWQDLKFNKELADETRNVVQDSINYLEESGEYPDYLEYLKSYKVDIVSSYMVKSEMQRDYVQIDITALKGDVDVVLYKAANYEPQMNYYNVEWEEVYREDITETGNYEYDLSEYEDGVYLICLEPVEEENTETEGGITTYSYKQNRILAYDAFVARYGKKGEKLLSLFGIKSEDYNTLLFKSEWE